MNPHEPTPTQPALPPVALSRRRRWIIAIVTGIAVLGATGTFGLWYFAPCRDCSRSPILCTDPCELPTFG